MSHKGMTCFKRTQAGKGRKTEEIRKPTASQKRFLRTIQKLTRQSGGVPPTLNEIARALGVTKGTVSQLVRRMRERGWILPANGTHRSVRVA